MAVLGPVEFEARQDNDVQSKRPVFAKFVAAVGALRLEPWDTCTEEGRSKERLRRIGLTASTSGAAKFAMLVAIPLAIRYLGTERYALWMTISSLVAMLPVSDFGIGNGLLNAIAECHGRDDREGARRYISSALLMLTGTAAVLLGVFGAAYFFVPWGPLYNLQTTRAISEAGPSTAVFFVCFAIGVPLAAIQRTEMGYQDGFRVNVWTAFGAFVAIGALFLCIHLRASLPWLMFAICGAPLFATALNGAELFGLRKKWLRPSWSAVDREHIRRLFGLGVLFFALQACLSIINNADNIIGMHLLGADAVAEYSVSMRLFSITPLLIYMVLNAMWPAYGESIARGDFAWARRALLGSLAVIGAVTLAAGLILIVLGKQIIRVWVHGQVQPSRALLFGLAVWMLLTTSANAVSIFLNNANRLRPQVIAAAAMTVAAIGLKFLLVPRFGLPGLVWATNFAYILCIWVPIAALLPHTLRKMEANAVATKSTMSTDFNMLVDAGSQS